MACHLAIYIVKTFHQTGVLCFLRKNHASKSQIVPGVETMQEISLDVMNLAVIHISIVALLTLFVNLDLQCPWLVL